MKGNTCKFLTLFLAAALTAAPAAVTAEENDSSDSSLSSSESNASVLPDGVYTPDSFSWSGGTGRLKGISCTQVTITDGQAVAAIVFASNSYDKLRVGDEEYEGTISEDSSAFEIPVQLNANNDIAGRTTKMSQPHWIDYSIYIGLEEGSQDTSDAAENSNAPQIPGLQYVNSLSPEHAEYFELYYYENDISVLEIDTGDDTLQYFLAPEGTEIPAGVDREMSVVQTPVEKACIFEAPGSEEDSCTLESLQKAMKEEKVTIAGTYDTPDFKALVRSGCDLAVVPCDILKQQEDGAAALSQLEEQLSLLKIPMILDRSSDEKDEAGQEEWNRVFDLLFA